MIGSPGLRSHPGLLRDLKSTDSIIRQFIHRFLSFLPFSVCGATKSQPFDVCPALARPSLGVPSRNQAHWLATGYPLAHAKRQTGRGLLKILSQAHKVLKSPMCRCHGDFDSSFTPHSLLNTFFFQRRLRNFSSFLLHSHIVDRFIPLQHAVLQVCYAAGSTYRRRSGSPAGYGPPPGYRNHLRLLLDCHRGRRQLLYLWLRCQH